MLGNSDRGPALPGMENLGADAVMMGGIEEADEIPDGMEFVMSSVPDGELEMDVASNSKGAELLLSVKVRLVPVTLFLLSSLVCLSFIVQTYQKS